MPLPSTHPTSGKKRTTTRHRRRAKGKSLRYFRPEVEVLEAMVLPAPIAPATLIWVGGSGSWTDPSHWEDQANPAIQRVPGADDNAKIEISGITVSFSGTDSVQDVNSLSPIVLIGGGSTLTVTGHVSGTGGITLEGGTLASAIVDSGTTITATGQGGGTLDGVTLNGTLNIPSGTNATLAAPPGSPVGLTLGGGTINLYSSATLQIKGTQSVTGTGSIIFRAADNALPLSDLDSVISLTPNTTWTIGSGITIHGNSGTIGGAPGDNSVSVINQGTVGSDVANGTLLLSDGSWTNDGIIEALNGATTDAVGLSSNDDDGSIKVEGGSSLTTGGDLSNAGSITVGAGSTLTVGGIFSQTAGTTTVDGTLISTADQVNITGGTLDGSGTIQGVVQVTYPGVAEGNFRPIATITLDNLSQVYSGSPEAVSATTDPAGLAVDFTYDGSSTPPTAAGSYTVAATVDDPNYQGSTTGTLVISPATAAVSLSQLNQVYDGNPEAAAAATNPAGLQVAFTYNGSTNPPTNTGSYSVSATVDDPNYVGSASGTLVISQAPATITLQDLSQVYSGSPEAVTAATGPAGLQVDFTYNGNSTAPTLAGSYAIVATIDDSNYQGSTTGTLVINPATASITLNNLSQVYDGQPEPATAITGPAGLQVDFTYNGSTTPPSAADSYVVAASIDDPNYVGTASGTLVITPATAGVTLASLQQVYDGQPEAATATTSPAGLQVDFTYNGSSVLPTAAGNYAVEATVNDPNYVGSAGGTLVISQAPATVFLSDLQQAFDGQPETVAATTDPAGLKVDFTYNGSTTPPTNTGSYAVAATVDDPNYVGSASGTLVIGLSAANITLANLNQVYSGSPEPVTATTDPAGLALDFTYNGSSTPPTAAGSYAVTATLNDPNYQGSTNGTLVINPASAVVSLGNLSQVYSGQPEPASATTTPAGLNVNFTYDGSSTPPTAAGTYAVTATVDDPNYVGSTTGQLTIAKATAAVNLSSLQQTYDGQPSPVTATTVPAGLQVDLSYDGSSTPPTAAGTYAVTATVTDPNYDGSASGQLTIGKATAKVTLSSLSQIYDANPEPVTAATDPAGLQVNLTYNGSTTPPTGTGSYAIKATVADPNYQGSASGTLVISQATITVSLSNLKQVYDGQGEAATATTDAPVGVQVDLTYNGSTTPPTGAGIYAVAATVADPNYQGSTTGTLVISPATADVQLGELNQVFNGQPEAATAATSPAGLKVNLTYDGSSTPPTAAGDYAVSATVNDPNYVGTTSGTLEISQAPTITNSNKSNNVIFTFTEGSDGSFAVMTANGFPTTALSEVGNLPQGVTFVDNHHGTAFVSGTPADGTEGTYTITVTADNTVGGSSGPMTFVVNVVTPQESADLLNPATTVIAQGGNASAAVMGSSNSQAQVNLTGANAAAAALYVAGYSNNPTGTNPDSTTSSGSGSNSGPNTLAVKVQDAFVFFDVRVTGAADGTLTALFTLPPSAITLGQEDQFEIRYFDDTTGTWLTVKNNDGSAPTPQAQYDATHTLIGWNVTVVYGKTSTPTITKLTGTVFTLALPTAAPATTTIINPPLTFVTQTNNSDASNGLGSSATFASSSSLTLVLRVSQDTQLLASRGTLGVGGGGDVTVIPGYDDALLPWLRGVPWIWEMVRPDTTTPANGTPARASTEPAQPGATGAATEPPAVPGTSDEEEESEVGAIDALFTAVEPVALEQPLADDFMLDVPEAAMVATARAPSAAWALPLAGAALAMSRWEEKPAAARGRKYRPVLEAGC